MKPYQNLTDWPHVYTGTYGPLHTEPFQSPVVNAALAGFEEILTNIQAEDKKFDAHKKRMLTTENFKNLLG